jgi:hypothetical protein
MDMHKAFEAVGVAGEPEMLHLPVSKNTIPVEVVGEADSRVCFVYEARIVTPKR